MIIAVDGPAAAGKGTLARKLAQHFGYFYLDTGALYRRVALALLQQDKSSADVEAAHHIAQRLNDYPFQEADLRRDAVGAEASRVAVLPEVRASLIALQRNFAKQRPGAVLDGRDIGTVICPEAEVKLFVTASPEVRAKRRWQELQATSEDMSYAHVLQDVIARDTRDANRAIAPLKPAPDAVLLDTSEMTIEQAFQQAVALVLQAQA